MDARLRDNIWTEKYRPNRLKELVGQKNVIERLEALVKSGSIPHMLFAGPPGVGKTTAAVALARELFGDSWRENFLETNASDERGIDVVRVKIKNFARTLPVGGGRFRIIFLDECDALTRDAQNALRRTMEKYSGTCRFVLSCNYINKIIDPIQSRCATFRFLALKEGDVRKYVENLSKGEGIKLDEKALFALVSISEGDLRTATNILQAATVGEKKITEKEIYSVARALAPEKVSEVLRLAAVDGNFGKARDLLFETMAQEGLSGEEVLKAFHREVFSIQSIGAAEKMKLVALLSEYSFRILEGANERIQLDGFLAQASLLAASSPKGNGD
ncbi:MAG: replication factor C small subunit [archaeon]